MDQFLKKSIPHSYSMGEINVFFFVYMIHDQLTKTTQFIKSVGKLANESITLTDLAIKATRNAFVQSRSFSVFSCIIHINLSKLI